MEYVEQWIEKFNNAVSLIVEQVQADEGLKSLIAKIKHDTFWENTHGWAPLKDETVRRKKRSAKQEGLAGAPEDPNIRTGDLVDAFSNAVNVEIDKDFKISYRLSGFQKEKVATVQEWGRDPEEITDQEYEKITEYITTVLIEKIKAQYG